MTWLQSMGRANKILEWPRILSGVGESKTVCEEGVYEIKIPLHDGKDIS